MITTPIHDFITAYKKKNSIRCHTPGHKGIFHPHDITEIAGALSIIEESERIASGLFGSQATFYSCSGSTLAIQTMLTLVKQRRDNASRSTRIAAFRYAHRSFVSAAALLGFDVDWFYSDKDISSALHPDTSAVFMNSLDYHGNIYDIGRAAEICNDVKIPLLVDNAHGAYLTFTGRHPLSLGAAMTADSAHKTLPVLTGGAYLHVNDVEYIPDVKTTMSLFGTSSPSYLVLESLDLCNRHIAGGKPEAFGHVAGLKERLDYIHESDELRVTINACDYGYTGFEFADKLRRQNVEPEYADINRTVLLFSTVTTKADTDAVLAAVSAVKRRKRLEPVTKFMAEPEQVMSIRDALLGSDSERIPVSASTGRVCAELQAPCPPGVPVVMPGERICTDCAELLRIYGISNIRVLKNI